MSSLLISNKKNLPILGRGVYLALGLAALVGCSSSSDGGSNDSGPVVARTIGDAKPGAAGSVLREWWSALPDMDPFVTKLRDQISQTTPTGTDSLTTLQSHSFIPGEETKVKNWDKDFGERIRGFIKAPTTGAYRFLVSGDNQVQFFLSTDESSAPIKAAIKKCQLVTDGTGMVCPDATAMTLDYTPATTFTETSQISMPLMLTAGKLYFFEWYHREGQGDTHAMVKWAKPGDDISKPEGLEIVPASALVFPDFEKEVTGTGTGGASGTGGATGTGGTK